MHDFRGPDGSIVPAQEYKNAVQLGRLNVIRAFYINPRSAKLTDTLPATTK